MARGFKTAEQRRAEQSAKAAQRRAEQGRKALTTERIEEFLVADHMRTASFRLADKEYAISKNADGTLTMTPLAR